MHEPEKSPLESLAERLPELLGKLEKSLGEDATASDHAKAFDLGCSLLNDLIKALEQPNSPLRSMDNAKGYGVSIFGDGLERFLNQEKKLLEQFKLQPKQIERVLAILTAAHRDGETRDLQVEASQVIEALSQLREVVCAVKVHAKDGNKIPADLIGACYDSTFDVAIIAGDAAVIPFSLAHGNPGGVILGISSIGVGVRNLVKHVKKAKELLQRFRTNLRINILHEKAPPKLNLKPKPK
jgi:hypothetical protein